MTNCDGCGEELTTPPIQLDGEDGRQYRFCDIECYILHQTDYPEGLFSLQESSVENLLWKMEENYRKGTSMNEIPEDAERIQQADLDELQELMQKAGGNVSIVSPVPRSDKEKQIDLASLALGIEIKKEFLRRIKEAKNPDDVLKYSLAMSMIIFGQAEGKLSVGGWADESGGIEYVG